MDSSLVTALAITAIGMSLLFLTLAFFYGLLSFLTSAFRDRPSEMAQPVPGLIRGEGKEGRDEAVLRAAAIAVALARTEAEQGTTLPSTPALDAVGAEKQISSWWALHHQRQLMLPRNAQRGR